MRNALNETESAASPGWRRDGVELLAGGADLDELGREGIGRGTHKGGTQEAALRDDQATRRPVGPEAGEGRERALRVSPEREIHKLEIRIAKRVVVVEQGAG